MRSHVRIGTSITLATVIATGVLLSGCAPGDQGSDDRPTELSFAFTGGKAAQDAWNAAIAEFNDAHPDIVVKAEPVASSGWDDFFNKISTQIAGGDAPDIMQVAIEGQRMFVDSGLLEPLDDYIANDSEQMDDFFADVAPNLLAWNEQYASTDGKTYYLPGDFNTIGLWANKSVFREAGVALPTNEEGWTWDEFEEASRQIKERTGAYAMNVTSTYSTGLLPWVNSNGATVMNEDWSKATVDTPEVAEAVAFARGLVEQGLSPVPGGDFDETATFGQGRLAMFAGGQWTIAGLRAQGLIDDAQLVPWPHNDGATKKTPVGYLGYPILASSDNKDAAWEFLAFLATQQAQEVLVEQGSDAIPPRLSVATSQSFLADVPEGTAGLTENLATGSVIPGPVNGAQFVTTIQDGFSQILIGNTSVEEGLAETQDELESILAD